MAVWPGGCATCIRRERKGHGLTEDVLRTSSGELPMTMSACAVDIGCPRQKGLPLPPASLLTVDTPLVRIHRIHGAQ